MCRQENKKPALRICDCGLAEYRGILAKQFELRDRRLAQEIPNTVLMVEHAPVVTLGARESANRLLVDEKMLAKKQIEVVSVRRGGGVTAHNPGQLVFYPIFGLRQLGIGINEYIRELEEIGIELLGQLKVVAKRKSGFPGLWVGERKIASIGVRVSKLVTYHGMAINIQNDLSIFDLFVPCGLDGVEMTSVLKESGNENSIDEVKKELSRLLVGHFSSEGMVEYEKCS